MATATGALILSTAGSAMAATTVVRPGPELNGWTLAAEGKTTDVTDQFNNASGWVDAATAGSTSGAVRLVPKQGAAEGQGIVAGLHTDAYGDTALSAITSMTVRVKTDGSGTGPRVVVRAAGLGMVNSPCNLTFAMPSSSTWTTHNLMTEALWYDVDKCLNGTLHEAQTWDQIKALAPATAKIDDNPLDGADGVRILTGDTHTAAYATAYVDWFEFNGATSDFEAPTLTLAGVTASIPAGGSVSLPLASTLSGPNQPGFGNSLGFLAGNDGVTSSASVVVTSKPAGLCTAAASTVSYPPVNAGDPMVKGRTPLDQSVTKLLDPITVTTTAGDGGTCTISLANPVNATVSGSVTLTVTKTPTITTPPVTPPSATPVQCTATAVSNKSKLKIQMGPALADNAKYKARVDVKKSGKWFRYLKFQYLSGPSYTKTVNPPKGTYRVKCYGPTEAQNNRSETVKIKK